MRKCGNLKEKIKMGNLYRPFAEKAQLGHLISFSKKIKSTKKDLHRTTTVWIIFSSIEFYDSLSKQCPKDMLIILLF